MIFLKKKYTEEIKEALVKVWYASNRICSKRLAVFLPEMVQIMHDKNHLNLEEKNKKLLATISASSIDRLLKTERALKKDEGNLLQMCAGHDVRVEGSSPSWADIERSIS